MRPKNFIKVTGAHPRKRAMAVEIAEERPSFMLSGLVDKAVYTRESPFVTYIFPTMASMWLGDEDTTSTLTDFFQSIAR